MTRERVVLLVEDDTDLRRFFQLVLRQHHFHVEAAEDGLEALYIIEAIRPDVVVLDLTLPRVKGTDVLAELESKAETKDIPVVIVTGSTEQPTNANVHCLLRKPVTADKLLATIEACINNPTSRVRARRARRRRV